MDPLEGGGCPRSLRSGPGWSIFGTVPAIKTDFLIASLECLPGKKRCFSGTPVPQIPTVAGSKEVRGGGEEGIAFLLWTKRMFQRVLEILISGWQCRNIHGSFWKTSCQESCLGCEVEPRLLAGES